MNAFFEAPKVPARLPSMDPSAVPEHARTWQFVEFRDLEAEETAARETPEITGSADDPGTHRDVRNIGREARVSGRFAAMAVIAMAAILGALVLLRILNFALRRDEHLYVPPAVLLEERGLYTDFFYNHVPGSAWLFHAVHLLSESVSPLLSGRLVVAASWVVLVALVIFTARTATRSWAVTGFLAAAFLANGYLHGPVGMIAGNNFLPLPFAFAGLAAFVVAIYHNDRRPVLVFASGVLLGLAVSMKLSAIAFVLPVAVASFLQPRGLAWGARLRNVTAPLALGGLVGGAPILFYLFQDSEVFLAHVMAWHTGPHIDHFTTTAEPVAFGLAARLELAHAIWLQGTNLILVCITAGLALMVALRRRELPTSVWRASKGPLAVLAATLVSTAIFAFVPRPAFPQYFVQPLIVLPLIVVVLAHVLNRSVRTNVSALLVAATLLMVATSAPGLVRYLPRVIDPNSWTVASIHRQGRELAAIVRDSGIPDGKVATLAPIYALEGGLPVYAELATGEFAYRSLELAEPRLRATMKATSPKTVGALLAEDPPAAILADPENGLESPLVAFAEANDYRKVPDWTLRDRYGTRSVWVRPKR